MCVGGWGERVCVWVGGVKECVCVCGWGGRVCVCVVVGEEGDGEVLMYDHIRVKRHSYIVSGKSSI